LPSAKAKTSPPPGDPVEVVLESDGQHLVISQPGVTYTLPEPVANYLKSSRGTRWE